jgi:NAD(P)-dependent dehydrogenase (short-subunit alcohol dehydrogenase family)
VVANAGICSANLLWEITAEQWAETIGVNLTGVFYTLKATVPGMIERQQGGSIVVISSVAGLKGQPFLGAYVASKHGVVGLVKTLANELGEHGIRVNSIHPTGVATGMAVVDLMPLLDRYASTLAPMYMNTIPKPAALQPEDVAAAVAWLAGEESRYITGAQIPVDLGALAR